MKKKIISICLVISVIASALFLFSVAGDAAKKEKKVNSNDKAFKMEETSNESFQSDKEIIIEKALNSIYNIKKASGEFIITDNRFNAVTKIEYAVKLNGIPKVYEKITYVSDNNRQGEVFTKNGNTIIVSEEEKEYVSTPSYGDASKQNLQSSKDPVKNLKPKDRMRKTQDGENVNYIMDDNFLLFSKDSLSPQNRIIGYLRDEDSWIVEGKETILGRECTVISGKATDEYYSEKQNVVDFKFYIDSETGILVNFVGYDKDGNLSQEIKTTRLDLKSDIKDDKFSKDLSKYKDVTDEYKVQ